MSERYGASRAEWEAFAKLNLEDVLPWVADPTAPLHPSTKMKSTAAKTPSIMISDARGTGAIGILGWAKPTRRTHSTKDWDQDPRLGICMQARRIKCFDIDIPSIPLALEIEAFIREELGISGMQLPLRDREGTGKRALIYRLSEGTIGDYQKIVVNDGEGIIEFLGDTRQFVVAGVNPKGGNYRWPQGIPASLEDIPVLDLEQVIELYDALWKTYGVKGFYRAWKYTDGRVSREHKVNKYKDDEVVQYLIDNDLFIDYSNNGGVYVKCPWEHLHSSESNGTDVEYFPAGSNGRREPGFKCLHGHSLAKEPLPEPTFVDFLEAIGYRSLEIASEFSVVEGSKEIAIPRPKFTTKGRSSVIENTISNVAAMLRWADGGGYHLRYDAFKDIIIYRVGTDAKWQAIDDDTYTAIRIRFAALGMEPPAHETVQRAVSYIAKEQAVDTAQEWLKAQEWDGVDRLSNFHTRVLGLSDTPYHRAVVDYLWTALAGRVIDPGCKADMVPILTGKQGLRKSSLVEALAPSPDEYTVVTLATQDADLARSLRGKLVAEWDELRGLNSRDVDALKGWVSRRKDDWIPKFKEFGTTLPRRFMLIGTANPLRFLNDPTGLRRWLPVVITKFVDVDYVLLHRSQLWAQAREMWKAEKERTGTTGILWQDAERLGKDAQKNASVRDPWVDAVQTWFLLTDGVGPWTSLEIINQACSMPVAQINFGTQERLRRVMAFMGWEELADGKWTPQFA